MRILMTGSGAGITRAVESEADQWNLEHSLQALHVTCLASDPTDSRVVYAGTREKGIWRSQDAGATWTQGGLKEQHIKSLAVSPHDPRVVYAGTKPAWMFRSSDAGDSWEELVGFRRIPNRWWWWSPADPPGWKAYVIEIAISPTDPGVLLAGIELGAVVRSEDGGQTWSSHRRGALRDCHSLRFNHSDGDFAYEAGGTGGGASLSRDGGRTWVKTHRGFEKGYGITCAADPEDPELWYASIGASPFNATGDSPEVYLYRSNGQAWQPIG